jgi:hypothetical protein
MRHWDKVEPYLWYGSWFFLFLTFFIGNSVTPYLVDDYCVAQVHGVGVKEAFYAGVKNAVCYWNNWDGGLLIYLFSTFFMNFDKVVFNVVNSFLFTLLVYLMCQIIDIPRNQRLAFWTLVMFFLSFVPVPGQTVLWLVGSTAYLWPLVFALLFLTSYSLYDSGREKTFLYKAGAFFCPVIGLMAGSSKGAVGGVCVLVSLMHIAKWKFERRSIPLWASVSTLSALIGCIVMVTSPGNFKRLHAGGEDNYTLMSGIAHQVLNIFQSQGVLAIILVVCSVFYFKYERKWKIFKLDTAIIYGSCALMGMVSLLIVPAVARTFLFFPCFVAIALGLMCKNIRFNKTATNMLIALFIVLVSNVSMSYFTLFYDAFRCKRIIDDRASFVEYEVVAQKELIAVPSLTDHAVYRRFTGGLTDLQESPEEWENQGFARFYGAKKIAGRRFCNGFAAEALLLYDK